MKIHTVSQCIETARTIQARMGTFAAAQFLRVQGFIVQDAVIILLRRS